MVEGLNAGFLVHSERMNKLIDPGCIFLFLGIFFPLLFESQSNISGRFTIAQLNVFNVFFSVLMALGLVMIAYGVTYRRKGDIVLPVVFCLLLLCSIDLFFWVYFVWLNWIPVPPALFILPLAPPGYIPLILTLFFILLFLVARLSYARDPRKLGQPKYTR